MTEKIEKIGFGAVDDNDNSLTSKTGGVFGLNSKCFITKLEYNPNAGADGAAADAIDITVQIMDKEYHRRIYSITGALYNNANIQIEPSDTEEYNKLYNDEIKQRMAVVVHAVKAVGVTTEQIATALQTPPDTFAEWAKIITALVANDFATKPIDTFLEYQWNIKEGQTRTFVEIPKNMKGGRFLCPYKAPTGKWQAVSDEKGLHYVDDAQNVHEFVRSANFMDSNKAKLQDSNNPNASGDKIEGGSASQSTW